MGLHIKQRCSRRQLPHLIRSRREWPPHHNEMASDQKNAAALGRGMLAGLISCLFCRLLAVGVPSPPGSVAGCALSAGP